jgi:hypothetical protein
MMLVAVYTYMLLLPNMQICMSAKSADTPVACLSQADGSTTSADTLTVVQAAPGDIPAPLEGMPSKPEDVTVMADTSDNVADFSDGVADTPGDMPDSPEDRQAGIGLPLSALQAGAEEEDQLKEDAATTTRRQAAPSSSAMPPLHLHSLEHPAATLSLGLLSPLGKPLSPLGGRRLRTSGLRRERSGSRTR